MKRFLFVLLVLGSGCSQSYKTVSLDTPCDSLSGRAIVDSILPTLNTRFTRTGAMMSDAMTITLKYDGGEVRCYPKGGGAAETVEIQLKAHVRLASGLFDDDLDLRINAGPASMPRTISLSASRPVKPLTGTFAPTIPGSRELVFSGDIVDGIKTKGSITEIGEGTSSAAIGKWE